MSLTGSGIDMRHILTAFAIRAAGRLALAIADIRIESDGSKFFACPH